MSLSPYEKKEKPFISNISFNILYEDEIKNMSVCEITKCGLSGESTIYDDRLGFKYKTKKKCITCNELYGTCPGHFGYYQLHRPIIHPLFYKNVIHILDTICHNCFRCVSTKKCKYCSYYRTYKILYDKDNYSIMFDKKIIDTKDIFNMIKKINKTEFLTHYGKNKFHPSQYIMSLLIITPSCIRPQLSRSSYDSLSVTLNNIIMTDKRLRNLNNSTHKNKYSQSFISLKNMIFHYFMSIKERINSKKGQIRCNIMGKRVNYSARTVIGPDSYLPSGYVGIPRFMADNMTTTEHVTYYNYKIMVQKRKNNKIKYIERNKKKYKNLELQKLFIGDVVYRVLENNDIVILNRQPSLHKHSMMAKKIKILPFKTIRFNLESTKGFNADFDGDEMNMYVPQTIESKAELIELSQNKYNFISYNNSKPILVPVQDALIGLYLMTKDPDFIIKKDYFQDILLCLENIDIQHTKTHIKCILQNLNRHFRYNGSTLLSFIFPTSFTYRYKDNFIIKQGVILKGIMDKDILYSDPESIMTHMIHEYDHIILTSFITNIQYVTNQWLMYIGFSIGLSDCISYRPTEYQKKIETYIQEHKINYIQNEGQLLSRLNMNTWNEKICKNIHKHKNNIYKAIKSGSKGSMFNLYHINLSLGQQMVLNKRISYQLNHGSRSSIYEPIQQTIPKYKSIESQGFIKSSFSDGLDPMEFMFHAIAGREGICNVSTNTSKSGYIYRCLIKLCEDICIKNDYTVRNSDNQIIQFVYGNHNLDPTRIVYSQHKIMDIKNIVGKLNDEYEKKIT